MDRVTSGKEMTVCYELSTSCSDACLFGNDKSIKIKTRCTSRAEYSTGCLNVDGLALKLTLVFTSCLCVFTVRYCSKGEIKTWGNRAGHNSSLSLIHLWFLILTYTSLRTLLHITVTPGCYFLPGTW